jgi:Protein of unknown function (DUF3592)
MPIRGIVLGLGLAFVALGWWRVLQRRGRATGTVTARPPRASRIRTASTGVTFQVGRTSYTFHPSVITNFDVGKLEVGAKVPVAYDPDDPQSADLAEPWRLYAGPVIATLLYAAVLYLRVPSVRRAPAQSPALRL